MKNTARTPAGTAFLCLACLVMGVALTLLWQACFPEAPPVENTEPEPPPVEEPEEPEEPEEESPALDPNKLPSDKLYITPGREGYADGDLRLIIPKLDIDIPILNGVDAATLRRGEGLYDYAQLPGEEGGNVSIAGHRNGVRDGKPVPTRPFYYVNTLGEGDYLYLRDSENIYQYVWQRSEVIEEDDWTAIMTQGFNCVTLTTCTPIGIADHRLMIRGELVGTLPLDETYAYPAGRTEESA